MRTKIKDILFPTSPILDQTHEVCGWVKTKREQKSLTFFNINDGSTFSSLQVIVDNSKMDPSTLTKIVTGSALRIEGKITKSPAKGQKFEMHPTNIEILGTCDPSYPLQKKRHTFEFVRTIAHLRPRTNTQGAIIRVRNALAYSTHQFFQDRGFYYIHTPIITASDCEGGGELFRVTTLDSCAEDPSQDFFNKITYLTVSGQLNAEAITCALCDVYTFGPTFRAENSHTSRHLAEFWMIEPEMAFANLQDDMKCAESYLKFIIQKTLDSCEEDIKFFDQFIEKGLILRLENVLNHPFEHLTYLEAISILEKSKKSFEFPIKWGLDLQSEHERYLTEEYLKKPVFITDFPEKIKAFYMRQNDDNKTVAAMDLLVAKVGELIGGSQREERYDILEKKMDKVGINREEYQWYLDLRKYGTIPHAGFGLGFERLVQFVCGMENIRDVIPFPRYPGHCEF